MILNVNSKKKKERKTWNENYIEKHKKILHKQISLLLLGIAFAQQITDCFSTKKTANR